MPSPSGIFDGLGYTLDELQAFQKIFTEQALFGQRTSVSGGAKSGGKQFQMTPQQGIIEVKFAIVRLTGQYPVNKVEQVLTPNGRCGGINGY